VHDDSLFIGSFDGWLYALHAKTGKLLWKFHTVGDASFPKGELQKAILYHDQTLYAGSRDYNIYAIDPNTGRGKWNMKEKGSWIIATPLAVNNLLYFGTSDSHTFYCMDATRGAVRWRLPLNMRVYGSAVAEGNCVYFGCFNGKIYGVDAAKGIIRKTFQTAASKRNYTSVYGDDEHFRKDFELYGKDMTEAEKKILSLGSFLATPLLQDGVLYIGSADGNFYAIPVRSTDLP
jgi:eukaryotic-like serine/threonine-protein kinase